MSLRDVATVERGTAPAECAAFAGSESVWLVELRAVGSVDLAPAFAALDGPVQVARLADATVVQFRRAPDAEGVGAAVAAAIPRAVVSDRRSGVGRAIGGRAAAIVEVPGVTGAWNPATARIVRVIGPDLAELDRLRDALRARIPAAYDAEAPPRPSVEVTVDPERAEALGLAPDVVARGLAAAWEGLPVAGLPLGGAVADGAIPVVIRVGADGAPLGDATFPGPAGAVPVAAAATLVRGTDRSILRVDRQRAVELAVTGDADLAGAVAEVPLAPGYRIVIVPPDR